MPPPPPAPPPPPPLVFAFTSSKQKRRSSKWSWGLGKKKKEVEAAPRERKNLNTLPVYQPGQFERRDASLRSKVSGMAQNTSSSRSSTPRPSPPLMASGSSTSLVTSASLERKIHDGVESILDGNVNTTERLAGLRGEMDKASVDFYIVPSEDAHGSEYVAASDKRREFITGFTGSSGVAIVSKDHAYLVIDSRYWIQAENHTDRNWQIIRAGDNNTSKSYKDWVEFLLAILSTGQRIGIDARMISQEKASLIGSKMMRLSCKLTFPLQNLVDLVWKDKPLKPRGVVYVQPVKYTGRDTTYKLCQLREWIKAQPPSIPPYWETTEATPQQTHVGMLVASLSCIAWTLNLRGDDVPFNLHFHAYLYVGLDKAILFLGSPKVNENLAQYLENLNVERRDYADLWPFLRRREWGEGKLLIPPSISYAISLMLTQSRYTLAPNKVEYLMAIKNEVEVEGLMRAYIRDGVAFVRFLAWLENKLKSGYKITEWQAAQGLEKFRGMEKNFMSFACETISVSGPNAALPHLTSKGPSATMIGPDTPYVVGWGTHYKDGTCNTMRTFHFGWPKPDMKEAYTRALQTLIAFENAVFLEGMSKSDLDLLVRKAQPDGGYGLDARPETGYHPAVNVQEYGPDSTVPLVQGRVITNEPGFYIQDRWGVRIGNTFLVKVKSQFDDNVWLGLERLTCVPIQTRMVEGSILTREEKVWLKEHNQRCWDVLSPFLQDDDGVLQWLKREADCETL